MMVNFLDDWLACAWWRHGSVILILFFDHSGDIKAIEWHQTGVCWTCRQFFWSTSRLINSCSKVVIPLLVDSSLLWCLFIVSFLFQDSCAGKLVSGVTLGIQQVIVFTFVFLLEWRNHMPCCILWDGDFQNRLLLERVCIWVWVCALRLMLWFSACDIGSRLLICLELLASKADFWSFVFCRLCFSFGQASFLFIQLLAWRLVISSILALGSNSLPRHLFTPLHRLEARVVLLCILIFLSTLCLIDFLVHDRCGFQFLTLNSVYMFAVNLCQNCHRVTAIVLEACLLLIWRRHLGLLRLFLRALGSTCVWHLLIFTNDSRFCLNPRQLKQRLILVLPQIRWLSTIMYRDFDWAIDVSLLARSLSLFLSLICVVHPRLRHTFQTFFRQNWSKSNELLALSKLVILLTWLLSGFWLWTTFEDLGYGLALLDFAYDLLDAVSWLVMLKLR